MIRPTWWRGGWGENDLQLTCRWSKVSGRGVNYLENWNYGDVQACGEIPWDSKKNGILVQIFESGLLNFVWLWFTLDVIQHTNIPIIKIVDVVIAPVTKNMDREVKAKLS